MRCNLPILVSRTLAFLPLPLIATTVARTIWLKFRWRLSANQMITLESLHSAALSPSSTSWKNWWADCVRWFCGAMVTSNNFAPSLYLHCLLISTEILHYSGTITRPTMGRSWWTVSESQSRESSRGWSNRDTTISTLPWNLQLKHLKVYPQ